MKKVMNVIVTLATTIVTTLLVMDSAVPLKPKSFDAPPLLSACLIFSTMWYFVSRKTELAPPPRQVVDVVGDLVHEVVHLVDERRDEHVRDQGERGEHEHVDDPDRPAAPLDPPPVEPVDERVEREREEDCDQDPGEDLLGDQNDLDQDPDGQDEAEHTKDGARRHTNDPLRITLQQDRGTVGRAALG